MSDIDPFQAARDKEVKRVRSGIEHIVSLGNSAVKHYDSAEPDASHERRINSHIAEMHATLDILADFIETVREQLPAIPEEELSEVDLYVQGKTDDEISWADFARQSAHPVEQ